LVIPTFKLVADKRLLVSPAHRRTVSLTSDPPPDGFAVATLLPADAPDYFGAVI
jgi:hypothetical protein